MTTRGSGFAPWLGGDLVVEKCGYDAPDYLVDSATIER